MKRIINFIRKANEFVLNLIFPPRCIFCKKLMEPNSKLYICSNCGKEIEFCYEKECCQKCGKPIIGYGTKHTCYFCNNQNPKYFDRIISVFVYDGPVEDGVLTFKAKRYKHHTDIFAELVASEIKSRYEGISFDLLCGPPGHNRKHDFDQVDLLCSEVSKNTKIEYRKNMFRHTRKVKKQSELSRSERFQNMKNSLKVCDKHNLAEKTVLLVDDVCTTRATVMECSRALKSAGAKRVFAVTIATTLENSDN